MSLLTLFILFIASTFAGLIDAIAGGGGIITIPALLSAGLPPHLALGTNKLQASFGSFSASFQYWRKGLVRLRDCLWGMAFTFLGAVAGTLVIQSLSSGFLKYLIPVFLGVIFLYTLLSPKFGVKESKPKLGTVPFSILFGLLIGFYDGFFGPGTGSFWTVAYLAILGFGLRAAVAHTKIMNFTSNIASLLFFSLHGNVILSIGLLMGLGQFLGAWIGSHVVIHKELKYLRLVFLLVVGATIARLLYVQFFS